ncbi:MAG: hypothetical protein J7639_05150 [Paenibacillaceae bacterium]|nr:hypothetical protein [Paenibacillaceae bacterium]
MPKLLLSGDSLLFALAGIAASLLLLALCYIWLRGLLMLALGRRTARLRLLHVQRRRLGHRLAALVGRSLPLQRHLAVLLEASRNRLTLPVFMTISLLLFFGGFAGGALFFASIKGVIVLSGIVACLPYLWLRLKLVGLQLRTRLEFLPVVEVLYQAYVMSPHKNVRNVLSAVLAERRVAYPLQPVFAQLQRNLAADREVEECLRVFTFTLGHQWADYLAGILRIALQEGNDVADNLRELIADMRKAQHADQTERNKLLEIRIASFSPIFFLALFLFVNFKINPHNAYLYYVLDAKGRGMILDALLLIFGSFLMGLYLSMRRM